MKKLTHHYFNGRSYGEEVPKISVFDRGFLFGDSIYEVIPIYKGQLIGLEGHYKRLTNGLEYVGILTKNNFKKICFELLESFRQENAIIYYQISRGVSIPRSHLPSETSEANEFAFIKQFNWPTLAPDFIGKSVQTTIDLRWSMCSIKTTNLLPNILAKYEASKNDCSEAIMVRPDGTVSEGTSSNIFICSDNTILTPPLGPNILGGITRDQTIFVAKKCGFRVVERPILLSELESATELFLTASDLPIANIIRLNGNKKSSNEVSRILLKKYLELAYSNNFK